LNTSWYQLWLRIVSRQICSRGRLVYNDVYLSWFYCCLIQNVICILYNFNLHKFFSSFFIFDIFFFVNSIVWKMISYQRGRKRWRDLYEDLGCGEMTYFSWYGSKISLSSLGGSRRWISHNCLISCKGVSLLGSSVVNIFTFTIKKKNFVCN